MTNLQYEIRVPQKIYRRATIHYWAWYDFLQNRRQIEVYEAKLYLQSHLCPFYYSKLEIVIKISRNSETLNGPTHSTIPNQPESKIRFHKKSPLHDFIRQTLIYYLVRHLASYCFCFLWVSVVKSSFILTVIQVVPRKGSLFLILCNGPPKYYEASYQDIELKKKSFASLNTSLDHFL